MTRCGISFLLVADVNHPESSAVTVTAIRVQKYFLLINNCDAHIVELVPEVAIVIFNINEVVTAFCATIVYAHGMQSISTFLVFYR